MPGIGGEMTITTRVSGIPTTMRRMTLGSGEKATMESKPIVEFGDHKFHGNIYLDSNRQWARGHCPVLVLWRGGPVDRGNLPVGHVHRQRRRFVHYRLFFDPDRS